MIAIFLITAITGSTRLQRVCAKRRPVVCWVWRCWYSLATPTQCNPNPSLTSFGTAGLFTYTRLLAVTLTLSLVYHFIILIVIFNAHLTMLTTICVSIRPSVTLVIHAQTVKHIEVFFAPSDKAMLDARFLRGS